MTEIPQLKMVFVCRSALEPLRPGSVLGYECKLCQLPLQMTQEGVERSAKNPDALILCNSCGLAYVKESEKQDKLACVELTKTAEDGMADVVDNPMKEWVKEYREKEIIN